MRRTMVAAAFAAAAAFLAPGGASAASATAALDRTPAASAEPVQYYADRYGYGGHFDGWRHDRHDRRHMRRAYEEERIAEAARREARRIEIERAERRAWRHAQRERFWRHNGF